MGGEIITSYNRGKALTILGTENGWSKVQIDGVTGYVKAEYCVTGEAAVELAPKVGTRIATVTTTTLKVRKEASTESEVLGLVPIDDEKLKLDGTFTRDNWIKWRG